MTSPLGKMLARPWLDCLILQGLQRFFFPLSRLWAAARAANGDVERFLSAVPLPDNNIDKISVQRALVAFERERAAIHEAEMRWREVFFDAQDVPVETLLQLEQNRLATRSRYNAMRRRFHRLRNALQTTVYPHFASPQDLESKYGTCPAALLQRFMPPAELPPVQQSQSIPTAYGRDFWLRFDSPAAHMGDQVYARVHEPLGVNNPPTLIFGHGICAEFDHWRNLVDDVESLPQWGIRVIRPEGPWHGRRVPDGYFGGEYFLSSAPQGAFDFFTAQHQEWAVLMDWARRNSQGPIAFGGSSLGAQSAQITAIHARHWPQHLQPDALFLLTHCCHVWEVALDGDLADIWGLHAPLHKLGWDRALMEHWLSKLDPSGSPVVPPERIVSVLGRYDRVTPFASGKRLQELWGLPAENRFIWPCGHFTVPLRLSGDRRPFERLQAIFADRV